MGWNNWRISWSVLAVKQFLLIRRCLILTGHCATFVTRWETSGPVGLVGGHGCGHAKHRMCGGRAKGHQSYKIRMFLDIYLYYKRSRHKVMSESSRDDDDDDDKAVVSFPSPSHRFPSKLTRRFFHWWNSWNSVDFIVDLRSRLS